LDSGSHFGPATKLAMLAPGLVVAATSIVSLLVSAGNCAPRGAVDNVVPGHGSPAAAGRSVLLDGYVLKQDCKTTGPQTITVTARGVRCEALRSHLILLCTPPDWRVLVYNPQTKLSFVTPFKRFTGYLQRQMVLFSNTSYFDKPVVLKSRQPLLGFQGILYTEPPGYTAKRLAGYQRRMVTGGEPAVIRYKTLALPGLPVEEDSILGRYYGVPEKSGLPVSYDFVSVSEEKRNFLKTAMVTKQKVDEALFKPPPGLTVSKNVEDVFVDGRAEGSDELIEMFDRKPEKGPAK